MIQVKLDDYYEEQKETLMKPDLSNEQISTIRNRVNNGEHKIHVANELGISLYLIKKYTQDIHPKQGISFELLQQIRRDVLAGDSKRLVADRYNLARSTVIRYTRDIQLGRDPPHSKRDRLSKEEVERIRTEVLIRDSKAEAARNLGYSYDLIKWYTQDIKTRGQKSRRRISQEEIVEIRKRVRQGKSRLQVSKELKISYSAVTRLTEDIPTEIELFRIHCIEVLKIIIAEGYYLCKSREFKVYSILKEDFPNIIRVRLHNKTILFLRDKGDVAVRAFLNSLDRKITNYVELKQILDAFDAKMNQEEKKGFINKKREKNCNSDQKFETPRLRENAVSFVKHYFTNYSVVHKSYILGWFWGVVAGRRWTVDGELPSGFLLRKVLSRSEPGHRASGRGESLCRGTETAQPATHAMIHRGDEVVAGPGETAYLLLEQAQTAGSVVQTARR